MVTGSFIHFITVGYTNIEKFYKKSRCAIYTSVISIVINLGLNYICIQLFGFMAAAYTTAFSYFCATFVHYLLMKKYKIEDVFSSKHTFMIIGGFAVLNLSSMLLYKIPFYFRWLVLIAVIGLVVVLNRKTIVPLLKSKLGRK